MKSKIIQALVPVVLGALGTVVLAFYPASHAAFCSGVSVF